MLMLAVKFFLKNTEMAVLTNGRELLFARVKDAIEYCRISSSVKTIGFLSESEKTFVNSLSVLKGEKFGFFGGYENAQRTLFVAMPFWCDHPSVCQEISALTFTYRSERKLVHRDFLGAIMSLGIKREVVGDILCEEGRTVVFLLKSISNYVKEQIKKVGSVGVNITEGYFLPLPQFSELKNFSTTLSSMRLDCVVSALCGVSREKAKEIIAEKRVSVDSFICDKITSNIKENSVISIKGIGRFIVVDCPLKTKKGRTVLNYKKYL